MYFILGYLTGMILTLFLVFGVGFLFFRYQKPIERQLNQWLAVSKPKGDFIQVPTETEITRKDKLNKLSKIKSEIRLSEIVNEEI